MYRRATIEDLPSSKEANNAVDLSKPVDKVQMENKVKGSSIVVNPNFMTVTLLFKQFSKTVTIEVSQKSSLRELTVLLSSLLDYDIGGLQLDVKSKKDNKSEVGAFDMPFKQLSENLKTTEFYVTFLATGG